MLYVNIATQRKQIGRIEIQNMGRECGKSGRCLYEVTYKRGHLTVKFGLKHVRVEGVILLLKKVINRVQGQVKRYYAIPKDKVVTVGGVECLKCKDIPKRYNKPFGKWYGVQTGTVIDGDCAIYLHDLQRWIDWEVAGVMPMFD